MLKKIFMSEVEGMRPKGMPINRWMEGVREILGRVGMGVADGVRLTRNRNE